MEVSSEYETEAEKFIKTDAFHHSYLASALMKYNELEWIPSNNAVVYDFTGEYIG